MAKVALVFHLNLTHYSLNPHLRHFYLKSYLQKIIKAIRVPVNLSLTAEDLCCIQKTNPFVFEDLIKNSLIKFIKGTYSHALISEFPQDLGLQLKEANSAYNRLLPKSKILPVAALPEFDFLPEQQMILRRYCPFFLVNHTIIKHDPSSECRIIYRDLKQGWDTPYLLCVHKNTEYRRLYHQYLCERASSSELIKGIAWEAKGKLLICHVDFETILLNRVHFEGGKVSPPRIDLFTNLQNDYLKSDLNFIHLTEKELNSIQAKAYKVIFSKIKLEGRKTKRATIFRNKLIKLRSQCVPGRICDYLSCTTADYFVFDQKKIILDSSYEGRPGKVIIEKSGNWDKLFKRKIQNVKAQSPHFPHSWEELVP